MDDSEHVNDSLVAEGSVERSPSQPLVGDWLPGTGEVADLVRAADWSSTPLGPRERWPQSLRTIAGIVMESKLPMMLLWGPELTLIYNEACRPIYADRHPGALGRPIHEVWREIWHLIGPVISAVMSRGEAEFREDVPLAIHRRGKLEHACFTLAHTPVRVEDGSIGGVLVTLQETTEALASKQRHAAIFESSPFALALAKLPEVTFVAVNDAFLRTFECSRDEVLGKTCVDVALADAASHAEVHAKLLTRGPVRDFECTRTTTSGAQRYISLDVDWVSIGGEQHVLMTVQDVTARKEAEDARRLYEQAKLAEQAVRSSEAKFRGIVSTAADAIVSVDSRFTIMEWNDGAERIFGYTRAEALGASLEMLIPERHRSVHAKHVARFAAEPGLARRMEHGVATALRKGGEEISIDATISKLELDGELIMTVTARDITSQLRAEVEQRMLADLGGALASLDYDEALASLVRITANAMADFVAVFAADERGILRRRAAASKDPDKAWIADFMMDLPSSPGPSHPIWRAFQEQRPSISELDPGQYEAIAESPEHLRALQAAASRHTMVLPLLAAGQCVGAMKLASASRRFDARDLELAQELARRCAMFVENARLHRIERRATRVRDEVLGVVAHDLRNPLHAITLQASLLRRKSADPARRARDAGELIARSVTRMSRIIEDLLHVTRLEAGEFRLVRERLCVARLVATVIEMQRDQVVSQSIELRSEVAEGVPELWADEHRMLQVFENLIGNAAKFTTQGSITIGVERREHEAVLRVADTGEGIAAEHLPRLFDRFWQARDVKHGSLGLGLAIVKGIVEAHGGRVWAESEVGTGSTFFFTVPLAT